MCRSGVVSESVGAARTAAVGAPPRGSEAWQAGIRSRSRKSTGYLKDSYRGTVAVARAPKSMHARLSRGRPTRFAWNVLVRTCATPPPWQEGQAVSPDPCNAAALPRAVHRVKRPRPPVLHKPARDAAAAPAAAAAAAAVAAVAPGSCGADDLAGVWVE